MKIQIKQSVDQALQALNKQQREVISLRFGLEDGKKWVLQEIANEYNLTRERIRQIQNTALKQLRKDPCVQSLSEVVSHVEDTLRLCGGVSSEERLCLSCEASTKAEKNYVHLLLTIAEQFSQASETDHAEKHWYLDEESRDRAHGILEHLHTEIEKKKDAVLESQEVEGVLANAPYQCPADYTVITDLSKKVSRNYRGEWGIKGHPEIALNTLAGYITVVLRTEGKPLHFTEISKKISEAKGSPCHQESCHNELVRRKEFILVGRGMYALAGMGYRSGTVADIILAILKEKGPMTQAVIIERVKKERLVKDQSIVSVLNNNKQFVKNEDKEYCLAEE
ncbi:MAG: sigma factor-like helix-turn-helix DNA-binding protein [Candidatus Kaiserbacteria bacterium]|nr:sigma factor-like helix-turn-helix DNA-binding protein [Candidatus Kaiserbacteria bacterium]